MTVLRSLTYDLRLSSSRTYQVSEAGVRSGHVPLSGVLSLYRVGCVIRA